MDFFSGITIAVVAAVLSSWLTVLRFRHERWWERKADAYVELIDSLHEMGMMPSEYLSAGSDGKHLSEEDEAELWSQFDAARRRVWRIADSADFVISSDVLAAITRMNTDLGKANEHGHFVEYLDESNAAIDRCMKMVKVLGNKELGIKHKIGWKALVPGFVLDYFRELKDLSELLRKSEK